jgi:hypothetical protein
VSKPTTLISEATMAAAEQSIHLRSPHLRARRMLLPMKEHREKRQYIVFLVIQFEIVIHYATR